MRFALGIYCTPCGIGYAQLEELVVSKKGRQNVEKVFFHTIIINNLMFRRVCISVNMIIAIPDPFSSPCVIKHSFAFVTHAHSHSPL